MRNPGEAKLDGTVEPKVGLVFDEMNPEPGI